MSERVQAIHGDSREVLKTMAECSADSCVTDPPYALVSIVKRFANSPRSEKTENPGNPYGRTGQGFMGQKWDTGETAFDPDFWREVYRVLKPGGHLLAFSGTRTYHRMVVAIKDAGFEIRDQIGWAYGSGFPKSHDVSKGIDRAAGAERRVVSRGAPVKRMIPGADQNKDGWVKDNGREYVPSETEAATDSAKEWEGWGTALKPAWEPIVLARKPLSEGTVAANVLRWGTGAINVDGCRVETEAGVDDPRLGGAGAWRTDKAAKNVYAGGYAGQDIPSSPLGRWPANVVHDGSDEVLSAFPDAPGAVADASLDAPSQRTSGVYGPMKRLGEISQDDPNDGDVGFKMRPGARRGDAGSAARFFYTAKADAHDRIGSGHPTVKPVDLMQWLVRLVTPKGGLVLDPFAGTGATGEAAFREGMRCALVEREEKYYRDILRRIELMTAGEATRRHESIKAKIEGGRLKDDPGPLFAEVE